MNVKVLNENVKLFSSEKVELLKKCDDLLKTLSVLQTKNTDLEFEKNQHKISATCSEKINSSLKTKVGKLKCENDSLQRENENLRDDVNRLQTNMNILKCHDQKLETENINLLKYIAQIEKRTQRTGQSKLTSKSLKQFKTEAEKALWFAESYGLLPEALKCSTKEGRSLSIKFSSLKETEKEKIRQLVYILDKFAISNAAYYELSMLEKSLPRKYLIVQENEQLDKLFHIERQQYRGLC